MFHSKYVKFLRKRYFFLFLLYTYKENTLLPGLGVFWPQDYNLNNRGSGLPDNALYKLFML
jgi:hypothetical protein